MRLFLMEKHSFFSAGKEIHFSGRNLKIKALKLGEIQAKNVFIEKNY